MKAIVRHYVLLPAVLGLVLGAMGRAEADSITYTSPITSTLEVPHFVPQFDTALGTLTEVDFSATGSGSARIDYSPPQTITNGTFAHVEDFLYSLIGNNVSLGLFVSSSTFSTPGGGTVDVGGDFNFSTSITSGLNPFIGTGMALLNLQPTFTITNPSGLQQSIGDNGRDIFSSGTATLTYVYSVPEPPSVVLAGLGLALARGLGCWLSRRQRLAF